MEATVGTVESGATQVLACGTPLAARIWRPDRPGRYPVLLMRQPYGARIASTVTLAHPAWYAAQGYIVAVQDVRGSGESGGRWDILAHEAEDGAAACAWARGLPGGNGRLGLYGFSYQGMTQILALSGGGGADAIAPIMAPWDTRRQMACEGGAFRLAFNLGWAAQMAALQARRAADGAAFADLRAAASTPFVDAAAATQGGDNLARYLARYGHYRDWLAHLEDTDFWRARSPSRVAETAPGALGTPALCVGGWFDPFLEGTLDSFGAFQKAGAGTRLVVGAWSHLTWGGRSVDEIVLRHFDRHLRDRTGDDPAIEWQDVTTGAWRRFASLPDDRAVFALAGSGLAAAAGDGRLEPGNAATRPLRETFVHDPWRPVPARGLHLAAPFGLVDRADIDARADVAVFTSAPLETPLCLAGAAWLDARIAADAPAFDVHLVLSRVGAGGRTEALTSGYHRLHGPAARLRLRPVCATLAPGERLRLSVSGAAWPAFSVNPGTGAPPDTTPAHEHRPITLTLGGLAALSLTVAP